jgi:hypothetical protein
MLIHSLSAKGITLKTLLSSGQRDFGKELNSVIDRVAKMGIIEAYDIDTLAVILMNIEVRMIYQYWARIFGRNNFPFGRLPPPCVYTIDARIYRRLVENDQISASEMLRIQDIVEIMLFDIISNGKTAQFTATCPWWTESEFLRICSAVESFGFRHVSPLEMHARSGVISKTTKQVQAFIEQLEELVRSGERDISGITMADLAEPELQQGEMNSWMVLSDAIFSSIVYSTAAIDTMRALVRVLPGAEKPVGLPVELTKTQMIRITRRILDVGLRKFDDVVRSEAEFLRTVGRGALIFGSLSDYVRYITTIVENCV